MDPKRAVFVHSPEIERYHYPPECPLKTERAGLARGILAGMGLLWGDGRAEVAPEPASRQTLLAFHTARYLDVMQRTALGNLDIEAYAMGFGQPEVPVFREMYDYAALACGATLTATSMVAEGRARSAFNPSGGFHHAGPEHASGFCYMNDVALACEVLSRQGRRVLFLDVDAHHSDGVQNFFWTRRDVMTISFHESGETLFPGTGAADEIGEGPGRGFSVNVPLPAGTHDEAFLEAFDAVAPPLIRAFDPDIVVFEVGMDGLSGDPLAHLALTNNVYAEVTQSVLDAGKPLVVTGGGGYHPDATARGWALVWTVLCGEAQAHEAMNMGLGGVMLQSTDWQGGLRDRRLAPSQEQCQVVVNTIRRTVDAVRQAVFPIHGL